MGTTRSLRGHQIWLITHTITDQIGLHLVPLPLLISTKTEPLSLSLHVSASSVPLLPVRLIQSVASYRYAKYFVILNKSMIRFKKAQLTLFHLYSNT